MGGNIQKGKTQSSENSKKSENQQILPVKEKDLKHSANLGNARWFFTRQYLSWEVYNALPEEEKRLSDIAEILKEGYLDYLKRLRF